MIRLAVVLCIFPVLVGAEPVSIRSGEHDTFSRLVVSIGVDTEWQVSPIEGGYLLEIDGLTDGFQTDSIFERIPRTRLMEVSQSAPNTLFLAAECECYADAFLWQPGELVLDIVDGASPDAENVDNSPDASTDATPPVETAQSPLRLPNLMALQNSTPPDLAVPMELQSAPRTTDLDETEAALIEGLARAASQGFLDPAVRIVEDPAPVIAADQPPETIRDLPGPNPTAGQPGVGISSAMDRDLALIGDVLDAALDQQCLSGDLFELEAWADDRTFHEQVAALAEALAGEFGEEPREAQDKLARLYIHFGFGAEARVVLAADSAQSQTRQILIELAGIVDDYPGPYQMIAAQQGCETPAALWAFYVNPTPLTDDDRNQILQYFFALPQPLRGQFAPRLAEKFVDLGDPDAATKIMRASENRDVEVTHEVQAARALIADELDDPQLAIDVLSQEAQDNARTTPESLIRLIELALEQDQTPHEADLVLAAAMRQEYRSTPIAADLALSEARGRIKQGQYQDALDLMIERDDPEALAVVDRAYSALARLASPATFLEFGFEEVPEGVTAETENDMARRMIDLGFPERATMLLNGPAQREAAAERRYLRAEAGLGSQDYLTVIDELLGMSDPRARDLRAKAYTGLGEHRSALAASDSDQDGEGSSTLQFRAGAWERLTIEDDEVLSSFAEAVLSPSVTDPAESLAERRAIVAQSQESRRAVEALLLRFDGAISED